MYILEKSIFDYKEMKKKMKKIIIIDKERQEENMSRRRRRGRRRLMIDRYQAKDEVKHRASVEAKYTVK